MKIVYFFFSLMFLLRPWCFAQDEPTAVSSTIYTTARFKGSVVSIEKADPAEGKKAEIVVMDEGGKVKSFVITSGISVADRLGNTMPAQDIKAQDNVTVEYATNKAGVNRAITILVEPR